MRFLLSFVLIFISVFASAQVPMVLGGPQGIDVTRILTRNWMSIPVMSDTPAAPLTGSGWPGKGYIVHVAKANDTSVWQYTGKRWARIGGAAENNYTTLISGGKVQKNLTLNKFSVGAASYYINGVFYTSLLTQLNGFTKTPNANGRIDIIALGVSGPLIIQGTESPNPVTPNLGASRIQLGFAYYPPFDSLATFAGSSLQSVFVKPGVDSLFFVTKDTIIKVRDSVGTPKAGNLIDVSKDTVSFGDTMIKNTTFNTNGYTYRMLRSGGDTLLNITPQGDIMLKGRIVTDNPALFSLTLKGNRVAFLDSIDGTESFEPKMLIQYTPNRPGVTVYPVGLKGGINGENKAALNTTSADASVGALSHTAVGNNSSGSSITFLKDRTSVSNYKKNTGGTNLQANDVALDITASGGYYVSSLSNVAYKELGSIRIVVDSLSGTSYRSNMRFLTNNANNQFATERMRITNDGMLGINTTSSSVNNYKLWANGNARIGNLEILSGSNAGQTGQGIRIDGADQTFKFQCGNATGAAFQFAAWSNDTFPLGLFSSSKDNIKINLGFSRATGVASDTLVGNVFNIQPKYNIFYDSGHTVIRGIYYNPTIQALNKSTHIAYQNTTGNNLLNSTSGNTLIGTTSDSTFKLHVNGRVRISDTLTLSTSPISTDTSANDILIINSTNGRVSRYGGDWFKVPLEASATLDFPSTNNGNESDLTVTVTGASDGDVVAIGVPNSVNLNHSCFTAWVSASNTVTIRFNNYGTGALNPVSATFKVKVFK